MGFFDWLLGRKRADEVPPEHRPVTDPEITMATPIAGAGAEVAAEDHKNETEKALDDAVLRDRARW